MPLLSLFAISILAGVLFIINVNASRRRNNMTEAERRADDECTQEFIDEGW